MTQPKYMQNLSKHEIRGIKVKKSTSKTELFRI